MSSVKKANHPRNWRDTKDPRKNNIVEDIIMGNKETKNLNTMNSRRDHLPEKMMGKLSMIVKNSSNEYDCFQAARAIELLSTMDTESSLSETARQKIIDQLN